MDFVSEPGHELLTDLYELTMVQAYWREQRTAPAVFSLYPRTLPATRNFLVACGLDDVLSYLEKLRFSPQAINYLRTLGQFSDDFLAWLVDFSFSGQVRAVPEGTIMFAGEPFLEVEASLPEAQLVETVIINRIHAQTLAASKCARVVCAAQGRAVVDFGLRRMHGTEASVKNARAYFIAGAVATSNVLAGAVYDLPVTGTMAHSYVQSHDNELEAFRQFASLYPDTVLLVDTYDPLAGVQNVIRLANELGDDFKVKAIRLDSGDMAALSIAARRMLDEAGLENVGIFASGNLDEYTIAELLTRGARIDGFGVGTLMGVSADAPSLDFSYKLTSYDGKDRVKLSTAKQSLPGPKQIYRILENNIAIRDIIAGAEENHPGQPLLIPVMANGRRLDTDATDIVASTQRTKDGLASLSPHLLELNEVAEPYIVQVSDDLLERRRRLAMQETT